MAVRGMVIEFNKRVSLKKHFLLAILPTLFELDVQTLVDAIKTIPGVIGCRLIPKKLGLLFYDTEITRDALLEQLRNLFVAFTASHGLFPGPYELRLTVIDFSDKD
jgi:hypothetical protein